jgi:hypothetical protein
MGVSLDPQMTWMTFTPVNEQAAQEVAKGNWGENPVVTFEKGNVVLTTTYGTFTFSGPKLPDPNPDASKSLTDANSQMLNYNDSMFVDVFQLMMLMHKIANEQKGAAREARTAQQEAQQALLYKAAEDIRQAAGFALAAGIVSGAMQIAGGMFSMAGGIKAAGIQAKGMQGFKGMDAMTQQATLSNLGARTGAVTAGFSGVGQGMTGLGQMASSALTYASSLEQAEQKEHEADAQRASNFAESETEFLNSLRDMIRDVQEKIQAIQQATDDTTKQILRA